MKTFATLFSIAIMLISSASAANSADNTCNVAPDCSKGQSNIINNVVSLCDGKGTTYDMKKDVKDKRRDEAYAYEDAKAARRASTDVYQAAKDNAVLQKANAIKFERAKKRCDCARKKLAAYENSCPSDPKKYRTLKKRASEKSGELDKARQAALENAKSSEAVATSAKDTPTSPTDNDSSHQPTGVTQNDNKGFANSTSNDSFQNDNSLHTDNAVAADTSSTATSASSSDDFFQHNPHSNPANDLLPHSPHDSPKPDNSLFTDNAEPPPLEPVAAKDAMGLNDRHPPADPFLSDPREASFKSRGLNDGVPHTSEQRALAQQKQRSDFLNDMHETGLNEERADAREQMFQSRGLTKEEESQRQVLKDKKRRSDFGGDRLHEGVQARVDEQRAQAREYARRGKRESTPVRGQATRYCPKMHQRQGMCGYDRLAGSDSSSQGGKLPKDGHGVALPGIGGREYKGWKVKFFDPHTGEQLGRTDGYPVVDHMPFNKSNSKLPDARPNRVADLLPMTARDVFGRDPNTGKWQGRADVTVRLVPPSGVSLSVADDKARILGRSKRVAYFPTSQ